MDLSNSSDFFKVYYFFMYPCSRISFWIYSLRSTYLVKRSLPNSWAWMVNNLRSFLFIFANSLCEGRFCTGSTKSSGYWQMLNALMSFFTLSISAASSYFYLRSMVNFSWIYICYFPAEPESIVKSKTLSLLLVFDLIDYTLIKSFTSIFYY